MAQFDLKISPTAAIIERDLTLIINSIGWLGEVKVCNLFHRWQVAIYWSFKYKFFVINDITYFDLDSSYKEFVRMVDWYIQELKNQFNLYFNAIWC